MGEEYRQRRLALFERAYDATRNPIFAWRAYVDCLEADVPPPDWVLCYITRVACAFNGLSMPSILRAAPDDPVAAVFDALEMKRPGPGPAETFLSRDGRDLHLAMEVMKRGGSIYDVEAVATEYRVGRTTVYEAWDKWKEILSDSPLSLRDDSGPEPREQATSQSPPGS